MHIYKVQGSVGLRDQVYESFDCWFCRDVSFSSHCFGSANLHGKQYYIFNKPYSKDEYYKELKKWDLGSYKTYKDIQEKAQKHWAALPKKGEYDEQSVDSSGIFVHQSKKCTDCIEVIKGEDSRFLFMLRGAKDSYDISTWGDIERCYEGLVGEKAADVRFGLFCFEGAYNVDYSVLVTGGAMYNFGCIATRGKYLIFNKQYTKNEYFNMRDKIIAHMNELPYRDSLGRTYTYGEFFPSAVSPWAYNETLAQNMFPLSWAEAKKSGYAWRERKKEEHTITMNAHDLPDHIKDARKSILNETIGCVECGSGFKIISREFAYLKKKNLPLPRRCPFCRINGKIDIWMKELTLVEGVCSQCKKHIQISSSLVGANDVLCKACYQKEFV